MPQTRCVIMENRKDITVPMPEALRDQIDKQLEYGDSRSEWIRQAIREKLERADGGQGNDSAAVEPTAIAN